LGTEIERKFLVNDKSWKVGQPREIIQGYLNSDPLRTVRVRLDDELGWLTIKGKNEGVSRVEYEYKIPKEDAEKLLALCENSVVEKKRWVVPFKGLTWEVDEFLGDNFGLIVAEVELETEDQNIELPSWVGTEVSYEAKYYNSNLSQVPFCKW